MRFGLFAGGRGVGWQAGEGKAEERGKGGEARGPILAVGNEKSKVFFWDLGALEEWDGCDRGERGGQFKMPRGGRRKGVARPIAKGAGGKGKGTGAGLGAWGSGYRSVSIASETTATTTTNTTSTLFLNDRPTPNRNATPGDYSESLRESGLGRGSLGVGARAGIGLDILGDDPTPSRARLKFSTDDPFRALLPHRTHVVPRVTFAARQVAWSVGGEWMVVVGDQGMVAVFEGKGA